jgi:hypothetical protein
MSRKLTRKEIREGLETVPVEAILLGAQSGGALTPSQKEFARNLALGKSKAQSYREAISDKGTKKTQAAEGYKLARRPDIVQIKEAYSLAIEAAKHRTPAQLRELVIHQLTVHALDGEINPAQRLKAIELLGKVAEVSAFQTVAVVRHEKSSEELRGRLIEQLKTLTHGAVDAEQPGQKAQDADAAADSLLAELGAGGSKSAESDPTDPPPAQMAGQDHDSSTYTIPHTQPAEFNETHPDAPSNINDLGVSPVQCTGENLEDGSYIEGEGVQIPPGDWDVVDGEITPHGKVGPL